jgi:hypothetical protein
MLWWIPSSTVSGHALGANAQLQSQGQKETRRWKENL